jgi:DNA-binding phage protein
LTKKKNATARWLAKKMESNTFRAAYEKAGKEIDAIDTFMRLVDERRLALGVTKADLARKIGQNETSLRRLLTSGGNPTLKTMLELAGELGLTLTLAPRADMATPPSPTLKPKALKSAERELTA